MDTVSVKYRRGNLGVGLAVADGRVRLLVTAKVGAEEFTVGEHPTRVPPETGVQQAHALCKTLMDLLWPVYEYGQTIDNPVVEADRDTLTVSTKKEGPAQFGTVQSFDWFVARHTPPDLGRAVRLLAKVRTRWLTKVPAGVRAELDRMVHPHGD